MIIKTTPPPSLCTHSYSVLEVNLDTPTSTDNGLYRCDVITVHRSKHSLMSQDLELDLMMPTLDVTVSFDISVKRNFNFQIKMDVSKIVRSHLYVLY